MYHHRLSITNTQIYLNIYISKECDKAGVVDKSKLAIHGTALKATDQFQLFSCGATDQFNCPALQQLISWNIQCWNNWADCL